MNGEDQWDESGLIRALRAPGTQQELAGEEDVVAAFRAAVRQRRGARLRRLGVGGTTAAVVIGLSGGFAAAAYTNALPDPAQHIAHRALGSLGVPDTSASNPDDVTPAPATSGGAGHQGLGTPPAGGTESSPAPAPAPSSAASTAPGPAPTPTGSASPAPSAPSPSAPSSPPPTGDPDTPQRAASVSASAPVSRVEEGASVPIAVSVTSTAGGAWADRLVTLVAEPANGSRRVVGHARTDDRGNASITTPAILRTTRFWIVANGAHSEGIRVVVVPDLEARYSNGQILVSTSQTWAGDTVVVSVKGDGVARLTLDSSGEGVVAVTSARRPILYGVRLPGTAAHASAHTVVTVPRGSRTRPTEPGRA